MIVYGALMWALGKVVQTPEVCKVFLGSFWEAPLKREDNRILLEREKHDLMNELASLPSNAGTLMQHASISKTMIIIFYYMTYCFH